ncbi:MAG: NAD(P)H-dependent oxidoreductase [Gemmatimonadota bacterium]|nr:NAD(P)H-dependent oxidoreductase [Gemmatimonadota bacterium]
MDEIRALAFAGSLRERSYNRALLEAAVARAPENLAVDTLDLSPVPFYHGDVEDLGDPAPVQRLKSAIREADLVVIATPEYNGGLPAVTKNAVDWGSRPPRPQAWDGKPVAILGCTPGRLATAGAQRALRDALGQLNAYVMPQPRVMVSGVADLFDDDLELTDEDTDERLDKFMTAAAEWARRLHER